MKEYDVYVFDLDDTLIRESDYLETAYKEIALYFGEGVAGILNRYKKHGKDGIITWFLETSFGEATQVNIQTCLSILRSAYVEIDLIPEIVPFLFDISHRGVPIYILTNGNQEQQAKKIACVNFPDWLKPIVVYAEDFGAKPSASGMIHIMYASQSKKVVLIGNSEVDKICAERAGVDFIHVYDILLQVK